MVIVTVLGCVTRERSLLIITHSPALYYTLRYTPQEGDIIFQSLPHGDLVDAIEGITHSPYSHCGVVMRNREGKWVVAEGSRARLESKKWP